MPTYTQIKTRSPYLVSVSGTAGQNIECDIFLWNDPDSVPSTATVELSKDITANLTAYFDITPYMREYIKHTSYTEITADEAAMAVGEYCYATVKTYKDTVLQATTNYIGFLGYGDHSEGNNPTAGNYNVLMTEGTYYVTDSGTQGSISLFDDQVYTWSALYTGITSGGTTTINIDAGDLAVHIPYTLAAYASEGNTVEIKKNGAEHLTYTFEVVCEGKYTPVECDFVNKHGAWQRIIFFKVSKSSVESRNTEYKLMPTSVAYTVKDNIQQTFNHNLVEGIKCNTGWVPQAYDVTMKELLVSPKILINGVAHNVKTKSLELMTNLVDRNINYEIEFVQSHDTLQYIL
jgi:hypothetical protein